MATVPFLRDMVESTGWFTFSELADMIAIAESTPGPIGVNMATYVGYTAGMRSNALGAAIPSGIVGSAIATLGLVCPSIIIIIIIAGILAKFRQNKYVNAAFYGLRPASVGLIAAAGIGVVLIAFFNVKDLYQLATGIGSSGSFLSLLYWKQLVLAAVLIFLTIFFKPTKKLHPIVFILFSAVIGILI